MSKANTINEETFYMNEDRIVEIVINKFSKTMTIDDMRNNYLFDYDVVASLVNDNEIKLTGLAS